MKSIDLVDRYVPNFRARLVFLGGVSTISGLAEAGALLLAVQVALSLGLRSGLNIPLVGYYSHPLLIVIAFSLALVALVGHAVMARITARLTGDLLFRTRGRLVGSFSQASWPAQQEFSDGRLQEVSSTLCVRGAQVAQGLAVATSQAVMLAAFIGMALVSDLVATVMILLGGLPLVLIQRPLGRATKSRSRQFVDANTSYAESVNRLSRSAMELRIFGVQERALDDLEKESRAVAENLTSQRFALLFGSSVFKDLGVIVLVGCIAGLVFLDTSSLVAVGGAIILVVRSLASAQQLNAANQLTTESLPNLEGVHAVVTELDAALRQTGSARCSQVGSIEFRGVTFGYPGREAVLKSVNFRVARGEAVGIVGPSGGGKSTLLQLLLGLRGPRAGRVLVNGADVVEFSEASLADVWGLVPQEPQVFRGSLGDNIAYFRDLSSAELEAAANSANLGTVIADSPGGLNMQLGPGGSGLSGGQKQRLAIARALAGNPDCLILDEPSSALDDGAQRVLSEFLASVRGEKTIFMVAHSASAVSFCDRLLLVDAGQVVGIDPDEASRWLK